MMNAESMALLALSLTRGLPAARLLEALGKGYSVMEIMKLKPREFRELGIGNQAAISIISGESAKKAEREAAEVETLGGRIVDMNHSLFPDLLKEIHDPPLVLYLLGDPSLLQIPSIAIVGARKSSVYGEEVSRFLARELSGMGLCLVSGMARGVDTRVHLGTLEAGGKTIAVLGTGIDVPYPRENRSLYLRIRDEGCILSESPLGTPPAPRNFPARNRIISGLSWGTVITEAAEFSGSLITARLALEQNREVWAVPGNITSKNSYGPNYLIRQGAQPLLAPGDIIAGLPVHVLRELRCRQDQDRRSTGERKAVDKMGKGSLSTDESVVLEMLVPDRISNIDTLACKTGFDWPRLNGVLFNLEKRGLIRRISGNFYCGVL